MRASPSTCPGPCLGHLGHQNNHYTRPAPRDPPERCQLETRQDQSPKARSGPGGARLEERALTDPLQGYASRAAAGRLALSLHPDAATAAPYKGTPSADEKEMQWPLTMIGALSRHAARKTETISQRPLLPACGADATRWYSGSRSRDVIPSACAPPSRVSPHDSPKEEEPAPRAARAGNMLESWRARRQPPGIGRWRPIRAAPSPGALAPQASPLDHSITRTIFPDGRLPCSRSGRATRRRLADSAAGGGPLLPPRLPARRSPPSLLKYLSCFFPP